MYFTPAKYNDWLYTFFDLYKQSLQPWRHLLVQQMDVMKATGKCYRYFRYAAAGMDVAERLVRIYEKPSFGIETTEIEGKTYEVYEEIVKRRPFADFLHFRVPGAPRRPKLLVVPPLSGHFSTLTRGTSEGLLPYMDVYTIDWKNPRDVPLSKGHFHFDDFVSYCMDFMRRLAPDLTVLAVCQPSVPLVAAASLMNAQNDPGAPLSVVLMGGPIDARKSPTEVNEYAAGRTIEWFEQNVITRVPAYYPGAGRAVYPGFMQLFGFLNMNLNSHVQAYFDLYRNLIVGDGESVSAHKKFYDEYLSVMDLPAEFYLETVNMVFKEYALPSGTMTVNGQRVDVGDIKNTSILCIEGERDDISGLGQTKAALDLAMNLDPARKRYHLQKGVGHYGIFNGRRYREEVVPELVRFAKEQIAQYGSRSAAPSSEGPVSAISDVSVSHGKKGKS
ncbi:MAG: polyhydroxyalkanoate depolymerase [Rickettsiales bacterium]